MSDVQDSFVHIADLHFWRVAVNPLRLMNKRFLGNLNVALKRRREFAMANAEPFADAVAATGLKCVLITGDFASTALEEEFVAASRFVRGLRERGLEVHLVPGNHDVYTFESTRAKRFEKHFRDWLPTEGYPALRALPGGTPLVLAPTVVPRYLSARGRITDEQAAAVGELLARCGDTVVVAGHYPFLHKTHGYASNRFRRLENAGALRRVLGESGKHLLYVAGHVHRFSYVVDAQYPGLRQLTTGAFFRTDHDHGTDGEFAEVRVGGGGFAVKRHLHKAAWTTTAAPAE